MLHLGFLLYKEAPITEKSNKFFELHSIFAPKSKTTLMPFLLGHNADSAGLSILSIILRFSLEMTSNAPVLPADITISQSLFFTLSIASHILVSLPRFAASKGLSSLETLFKVWTISYLFSLTLFFNNLNILSLSPNIL